MGLTEIKPVRTNFHALICAFLWKCLGHSGIGIQLGSTEGLTSETVHCLVYSLLMFEAGVLQTITLTALVEAEVRRVSPSSCFCCNSKPQRKPRTRLLLELIDATDSHLEQRSRGQQTPQRWPSLWDRWCSQSGRPGPRSQLSERRWGKWTRRSRPSRSSTQWAGQKQRGLSRKLSGSALCSQSRMASAPPRSLPHHRHLQRQKR